MSNILQVLPIMFVLLLQHNLASAAEQMDPLNTGLRMMWGLLVVLAVIITLSILLKKRFSVFKQSEQGIIKIVEVKHIMPKKSLMVVEVRGQEFLVGSGNDAINSIIPLSQTKRTSFDSHLETSAEKLRHE